MEEKEQISVSVSPSPSSPLSTRSSTSSSSPISPTSPTSPSTASLLRSTHFLLTSLRHSNPRTLDATTRAQLAQTTQLLSTLSTHIQQQHRSHKTATATLRRQLAQLMDERDKELQRIKDESKRRRKVERQLVDDKVEQERDELLRKRQDADSAQRQQQLEAELGLLHNKMKQLDEDRRYERQRLEDEVRSLADKRNKYLRHYKLSQSTLHDTQQRLTVTQQELAAAERQQAALSEQRVREDEDRQQLAENRDEVIEANLRLLAELRQVKDRETELQLLKQQWDEERQRWQVKEDAWQAGEEERQRLQQDNSAWEGKWQHIQQQSATLAELTERMNGREEAMKEELASHWQREKLQMGQLMYDECNKHDQQTQYWKQQADNAQHQQQLLQLEVDALKQRAVEEAVQREKERSESQQKADEYQQQLQQLDDERKMLEQRDDEQQATIRHYTLQVRSSVDQLAAEQQTWRDEQVKHRKTVESKDEQLKAAEDKATQLQAEITRRQSLLSKEQQRSAALTLQLEQERQHSLTLIDPLLHQSVQLRLQQREDEVEVSKTREEEQTMLVSSLRTTITALEHSQASLRVEAEKGGEGLRLQLRVVSEEKRQAEVAAKAQEVQLSSELRERKQQLATAEEKLTTVTAERDAFRQAKDKAETERSRVQQEMEERLARSTDESKTQERHYTAMLNQQHTAHAAQLSDYQQRIIAATQQIETLTTDIATLSSSITTLNTQVADKDKSAALLTQQADQAKLDKAIVEQQLAAAQQQQTALQQQLFDHQQKATAADKLANRQLALLKQRHTFTEEAIAVLRTQVEDERARAAQLEQQRREAELKLESERRRADELRAEVEAVEAERTKAVARVPQLEREMEALRARESEYDSRLRVLSVQLRAKGDEAVERNRQWETEVEAVKDQKRIVEDEVKAERERLKERERELDRCQQLLTHEQDKVRNVTADLDEARQRNLALVDPLVHHALTLELNQAQQQLAALQQKETEQSNLAKQLRSQLASADESHSAYRSTVEQSQDELRALLRTTVADKRKLELQLKEALLNASTYKSDNERAVRNKDDSITQLKAQVATLTADLVHLKDVEAVHRQQADEQHVLYQSDKQRLEKEYQRLIRHQQDEQETALRAWEEQIALQALEIEQLTTDCLRERQHVDDEKARVCTANGEVRRLMADLVPQQESNSRLQRELVVAHDKHMQLLQQHVLHAQKQESDVRQLRATVLDQQQRITELLTRITSLNEAVVVGEERGKADVHERAVEVAEYSELVQRLKEEMQRMQDEQAVARREMAATVDALVKDMKAQTSSHENRVSELHQQRRRDEAEQQKELQHSATTAAALRAELGSLTADNKRLECATVVRTEEWAAEKTAMAAEASVLSTTVSTLKSKVDRVQAELEAEREMHAMTTQRMEDMVRHRGEEHAAIQSIIVTADNDTTNDEKTAADNSNNGNTTGRLHRRIASLTSELMAQHSEAETDSAMAQHSHQLFQAQIDVLQARLREKDNQLAAQLEQLHQLESADRRGRLSISASRLSPSIRGYSPRSSPVLSSTGSGYRGSERRSKDDLHWTEQKENTAELPSHSILRVHAAQVDNTTPFHLFASQDEKIDDTVTSHNKAKATNNKQQAFLSSLSSSFALPPLSATSPTSDTLIHLRSELRLKAIELDDANLTAATWERKWHDEADERARQQRQWSELLAKATDVNRELRVQLQQQESRAGKEEKRDTDTDSDASSCVEVEIEEIVGVQAVPTSNLSGQAVGNRQTVVRATTGRSSGRQGAAGGTGDRQAGSGRGGAGWDANDRDDEDDDEHQHRRNLSAHLPSHNDSSYKPTAADWSKTSPANDAFASRSASPRAGSGGRHERQSSMSELRVVNEELSARLTALEESNESLRLEKERLVREQQAAMDRNVQETARALEQEQLRVRQLRMELERERRMSGEGEGGQDRRAGTERSPARLLPRSTPASRLSSPRSQLSTSLSPASHLSVPLGSSLQSTVDSLTSTVRQQSDELASLRASLRSANRDKLDMLSQLSSTQPLAPNSRTQTLSTPSYSAESRLLLQLQQSETERMVLQGRLTQTQQQLALIEEERVERRQYEQEKESRREVEQQLLETERQMAEMEELLHLQQRETDEWKAAAEEREREMETMVRREEETLELLKQLETELGQKDQHIGQLKQQLQRVNGERQHEDEQRQLQRQRDELELSHLSQETDQLHIDLQAATDANSRLRREKEQAMDECERVKTEMSELQRQYSAQQRASRLYGEALEAQAQYVEGALAGGEQDGGSGRDGMRGLLELQATSIEQLLANESRARGQIAAIEDEASTSGEEGDSKQQLESKRRGTVVEEQKEPREERASGSSTAVQDRVSAARETLRRLKESHEARKMQRSSTGGM